MDPATLVIFCVIAARWLINRHEDHQAIKHGVEPPRWTRAKAKAAKTGRTPAQEYRAALWADAVDNQRKKHGVKSQERFARWEAKRADRQARRAARRASKGATATPPSSPPPATAEPTPTPKPTPVPTPAPASTGAAPSTTGAIPRMTNPVTVPPPGEINNQPTLVSRTVEWDKFHGALSASGEVAKAGADSWQKAAQLGVTSTELSLAFLARGEVEGPVVASFAAAKEQQGVMADLAGQISALYSRLMEANTLAKDAFVAAQQQMPSHINVREAHLAVEGSAGNTPFITSGG